MANFLQQIKGKNFVIPYDHPTKTMQGWSVVYLGEVDGEHYIWGNVWASRLSSRLLGGYTFWKAYLEGVTHFYRDGVQASLDDSPEYQEFKRKAQLLGIFPDTTCFFTGKKMKDSRYGRGSILRVSLNELRKMSWSPPPKKYNSGLTKFLYGTPKIDRNAPLEFDIVGTWEPYGNLWGE
jgi:hypothetical protein